MEHWEELNHRASQGGHLQVHRDRMRLLWLPNQRLVTRRLYQGPDLLRLRVVEIFVGFHIHRYGSVNCCRIRAFGSASCVHWKNGGVLEGWDLIVASREVWFVVRSESGQCVRNLMIPSGSLNDHKVGWGNQNVPTQEVPV